MPFPTPFTPVAGFELSFEVDQGNRSQKVAISTVSAQSTAMTTPSVLCTPDATCFVRQGANPTALATGVDQILLANNTYRLMVVVGNKLAFITAAGTGNVYITPEG